MKKIICTVTNDLNFDRRMIRVCTSLSNVGHEVVLVGRELSFSPPIKEQPFKQKRFRLFFNKGKLFYLEYNLRLFIYLLFTRFDILNSVDLDTLIPGYFISKIKRKICVHDAHEYFTEVPEVVNRPLVKKTWEAVANYVIPQLKYAYTVCDSLAEIFNEKYGVDFSVIRNVPFEKEEKKKACPEFTSGRKEKRGEKKELKKDNPFVLIYQGVLNEGRGLEEIISALPFLENTILWLFGEGDLSNELRGLVKKLNLEEKVKFFGRVVPSELHDHTCQAHLGLNLLKNKGLNYYYSLANKTFDYMQAGIPSLCMAFPEYEKINAKYGVFELVNNLSKKEIIRAINKIKKDEKYYNQLMENSLRAKKEFVWEKEEKKLLNIYGEI